MGTQATIDLGEARQNSLIFPVSLAEKYQPRIQDFIGIEEPKRIMLGLLKRPKPVNILALGDPGTGKTVMGTRFAEQLPAIHHHIKAQGCDLETLERTWLRLHYIPAAPAKFHLLHVDEADTMTPKAQEQLLSWIDGTACFQPVMGGGMQRGTPLPLITFFTANSRIENGVAKPPAELLPRFLSRMTVTLTFERAPADAQAKYLASIWRKEKGQAGMPLEYFEWMADGLSTRDALNRMDAELIAARSVRDVRKMLEQGTVNPDAVIIDEDEGRWTGFLLADSALERYFPDPKVARSEDASEIVVEALGKCRTIVTTDAGTFLREQSKKQKIANKTRDGDCSWGLLVLPEKDQERAIRTSEILKGVRIGTKLVPWKAAALANLGVTVETSGKVRLAKLPRCEYCKERYTLPREWKLAEETAGEWRAA